jgi:hypothetical protein
MIEQFFRPARPPFILVRHRRLYIGDQEYEQLNVCIHEITPVRKLFVAGKLQCYSLDCRTAKNGRLCELCSDRHRCSRRLQLRLAYGEGQHQKPAILEIHRYWFDAFDKFLKSIDLIDNLPKITVTIKPEQNNGRTNLEFHRVK